MKKINLILLSCIFFTQNTYALPSGGKFTHGTTGSIVNSNNNMYINGSGVNSVISWGGGFNIQKGESVHFNGSNKNYLNIIYGKDKSTIDGLLNGNTNNIYLINPNGIIIGKTGTINANHFIASSSSLSSEEMFQFTQNGANFSPIFKNEKLGSIVNMGNIKAKNIMLIANNIELQQGKINSDTSQSKTHLIANNIFINMDTLGTQELIVSAYKQGVLAQSTSNFYMQNKLQNINLKTENYKNANINNPIISSNSFTKKALIFNDKDWMYFAKGWDNNTNNMRHFFSEFVLMDNIDFKGQNYLNYCISTDCYNLIIGKEDKNAFSSVFNGNGFSLENMSFNADKVDTSAYKEAFLYNGIFGVANKGEIKNIIIDFKNNNIFNTQTGYNGAFIGAADMSIFKDIYIKNINDFITYGHTGGFVGHSIGSTYENISLSKINKLDNQGLSTGAFAGYLDTIDTKINTLKNISINNIGTILGSDYTGGFVGRAKSVTFENIILNDIKNIQGIYSWSSSDVGGFAGYMKDSSFKNLYIYFNPLLKIIGTRKGKIFGRGDKNTFINASIFQDSANNTSWGYYEKNIQKDFNSYLNNNKNDFFNLIKQDINMKDAFLEEQNLIFANPKNSNSFIQNNVVLEKDDVDIDAIYEAIKDIFNNNYTIYLSKPDQVYGYNESVLSSLMFLSTLYKDEMKNILKQLSPQHLIFFTNFVEKNIYNNYKNLTHFINSQKEQIQNDLNQIEFNNKLIQAYNEYINLINNGLASKDDLYFLLKNKAQEGYTNNLILANKITNWFENLNYDFEGKNEKLVGTHGIYIPYNNIVHTGSLTVKNDINPALDILIQVNDNNQHSKPDYSNPLEYDKPNFNLNFLSILSNKEEKIKDSTQSDIEENPAKDFTPLCLVSAYAKTANTCLSY